jgi:valyl-tRNA synthetase
MDKWLLSRLNSTIKEITELSDAYKLPWVTEKLHDFIVNDISRWYIRLIREKIDVYSENPKKYQIMSFLFEVLFNVLLLLAPITPMLSEHIYLKMFKSFEKSLGLKMTKSIHLLDWPKFEESKIFDDLENQMEFTRELIEVARSLKNKNRIRLRWPNKKIIIESKESLPELEFTRTIKKMVNVKELEIVDSFSPDNNFASIESKFGNVFLDLSVNDLILSERVVNDLIRNIQYARKKNQFKVGEEISLKIGTESKILKSYIEDRKELIADKVSAPNLEIVDKPVEKKDNFILKELKICPNTECFASLKTNIVEKLDKKEDGVDCPYCATELAKNTIKTISFSFQKTS